MLSFEFEVEVREDIPEYGISKGQILKVKNARHHLRVSKLLCHTICEINNVQICIPNIYLLCLLPRPV